MTTIEQERFRARIACLTPGGATDAALTDFCAKAGYQLVASTSARKADIGLIDLRNVAAPAHRIGAVVEALRRNSPECGVLFLLEPAMAFRHAGALRRFGEVAVADAELDHVVTRIRETIRIRNIAEETGERLKSLAAINRTVEFPVIATDASPPRVLIVGAPGPAAIMAINAAGAVADICACVLTAGQAMRALDHQTFDLALFLPSVQDGAMAALVRALKRHPRHARTAILQIGDAADDLAAMARRGGVEFMLRDQISSELTRRAQHIARRARLVHSMRVFLRACAGEGVRDTLAGVFTPTFLTQHGARLAARADETNRALSVMLIQISEEAAERRIGRRASRQAARLIARVTRAEDVIARLAPGLFAVLCPATIAADATRVALRMEGVLRHTAFPRAGDGAPESLRATTVVHQHQTAAAISETIAAALRLLDAETGVRPPRRRSPQ